MLDLNGVTVFYNKIKILDNININIKDGIFFCFVGVNGSGKTTLLKTISKLINYKGSICINGVNIKKFSNKEYSKKVAFMTQVKNYDYPYKIIDTVLFSRFSYRKNIFMNFTDEDYNICKKALEIVGLEKKENLLINEISGGEQQRVFLAQIFAQDPEILVLDEPTTFLDLRYKVEILNYIKKWALDNCKTVICALHELDLILKYADQTALLNEGNIVLNGKPKDIIFSKEMKECFNIDITEFYKFQ